jgi:hypothetical protein
MVIEVMTTDILGRRNSRMHAEKGPSPENQMSQHSSNMAGRLEQKQFAKEGIKGAREANQIERLDGADDRTKSVGAFDIDVNYVGR